MKDRILMMTTEHSLLAIHVSQKVKTTSSKAIIIIFIITDLDYLSTWKYEF